MIAEIEHKEINGHSFALIPIIPFEDWFTQRIGNMEKFYKLTHKDKEKIFLRWKEGSQDEKANEQLDFSEITTLALFKDGDLSQLRPAWRFHIEQKRNFARICQETKERLGLIETKYNPLVEKIVDTFNAIQI